MRFVVKMVLRRKNINANIMLLVALIQQVRKDKATMRKYLIEDIKERRNLTNEEIAKRSDGILTEDMVKKQLSGRNKPKLEHANGWIKALNLSLEEFRQIFLED